MAIEVNSGFSIIFFFEVLMFWLVCLLMTGQDINKNLSIKDALAREEMFFRNQPVYS